MPEIALEPRPGDSLGPYRITRVIGRGRLGVVAEDNADGQEPPADLISPRPEISASVARALEKERPDRPHSASDHVAGVARAAGL
jgi:hypothetical protein